MGLPQGAAFSGKATAVGVYINSTEIKHRTEGSHENKKRLAIVGDGSDRLGDAHFQLEPGSSRFPCGRTEGSHTLRSFGGLA